VIAPLSPSRSRLLAILLLSICLVVVIAGLAVPAWSLHSHYDTIIDGMQGELEVHRRIAAQGDRYRSEYRRFTALQERDRRYLQSDTESLATAELQRVAKQVISGKGGEILSAQVVPGAEEEGFRRISILIRMKGSLEELVGIFHDIESQKPYLFIDDVNVRSRQIARRRLPASKGLDEVLSQLEVEFRLAGYMRGGQP
jgi:general secretion pathway protein M